MSSYWLNPRSWELVPDDSALDALKQVLSLWSQVRVSCPDANALYGVSSWNSSCDGRSTILLNVHFRSFMEEAAAFLSSCDKGGELPEDMVSVAGIECTYVDGPSCLQATSAFAYESVLLSCFVTPWTQPHVPIRVHEVLEDGELTSSHGFVRNVSEEVHIGVHCPQDDALQAAFGDLARGDTSRYTVLTFGRDFIPKLAEMPTEYHGLTIRRLDELEAAVREWHAQEVDWPRWRSKESGESKSNMDNPRISKALRFKNQSGAKVTMEKHVRLGGGKRIYYLLDEASRTICVGYAGVKPYKEEPRNRIRVRH